MPKDKNPEARLREINRLLTLRKGALVTTDELVRACGAGLRTLRKDIQYLRDQGAKIKTDYKQGGYTYEEPFDLVTMPMSADDIHRLKFAAATLSQFRHLDIFQGFAETVDKIEKSVERWLRSKPESEAIFFDPVPYYHGSVWIPVFLRAVRENRVVIFDYQSFKSDEVRRHEFHPWFLREHKHRWYVVGWLPSFDSITPFALDRVAGEPELLKLRFTKPKDFDPVVHFAHTVGMTVHRDKPIEDVILHFSPEQAPFFRSKPFHNFEALPTDEPGLLVQMRLIPNFELVRKLAEMGAGVRVLGPDFLVKEVKGYLQSAWEQYSLSKGNEAM
jgi:predicted DNA-binding transcriptional regulator YafY